MAEPINKTITFYNPYIAGLPITDPNLFFGRQADLEKIIDLLKNNFVMLVGSRHIGKTSMLHQLVCHLPRLTDTVEQFLPVLVSAEDTAEIDGHIAAISNIEAELTELGEDMTSFQPFQSE